MANKNIVQVIIDYLRKWGIDATNAASDVANWAAANPDKATMVAVLIKKAAISFKAMGGLKGMLEYGVILRNAGYSVKDIVLSFIKDTAAHAGSKAGLSFATKGAAIGSAFKIIGLIGAVIVANQTLKQAKISFNTKLKRLQDAWNEDNKDAGKIAKSGWELYWETRIPVVTYRWIESWFKKKPKVDESAVKAISLADVKKLAEDSYKSEIDKAIKEVSKVVDKTDWSHVGGPMNPKEWKSVNTKVTSAINDNREKHEQMLKDAEDVYAAATDMMKRPKEGTTAETMWRRKVESNMKRTGNDPIWYKKGRNNGIQYSGEYNFDTKNGNVNTSPLMTDGTYKVGLPSIAAETVALTIGKVTDDLLQNMYTDVTIKIKALNKNSALTSTWSRATLLKLIHTMRVIYAGWLCGTRAYMLVNEFDGSDQSLPAAYFCAMGFDWVTWQNNRAQIQEDLNYIASMLDVYVDFTKLDLFKRTEQLFLNGYTDGRSGKAQKILFRGDSDVTSYYNFSTGSWVRATGMLGTGPATLTASATGATYTAWKNAMVSAVNSLINSSTVQDMLSCLRFVFGTGERNFFKVPKSNDKFKFVYNEEVLSQIENSTPCVLNTGTYSLADDATNDWITETLSNPSFPATDRRFNSHNNHMSKDDQIVSTRLQLASLDGTIYYGTEVPTTFEIVVVDATSTYYKNLQKYVYSHGMTLAFNSPSNTATDVRNAYKQIQRVALLATFDWAPILSVSATIGSTNTTAVSATVTGILVADWESYAICYGTTVQSSLTWMSYMRNGNYSLHSIIQTELNAILDKAKTA